ITGNTASTPLPAGPIRKLSVTTAPTSKATMVDRTRKSYQGRVVGGICARRKGSTMKKQKPKTTTLRANADQAAQWTRLSGTVATSQTTNANAELIQIVRRCASKT